MSISGTGEYGEPTTTVDDLRPEDVMVDVRELDEWTAGHAPNAIHIPLGELPSRLDELPDTDETIPVVCRSGGRSGRAVQWLVQQGFDAANVEGGMRAWVVAGKPLQGERGEPRVI